ncbi:MAG: flippase-like domain-containing protein [Syntrophobacteraceae bacterium]|jgi:hypothetical protein|nr:flippase-like domain-containing protein [Syntrophobacteraceae bacterium]
MTKSGKLLVLKILVAIGLLVGIGYWVDWKEALRAMTGISPSGVGVLVILAYVLTVLSCIKWQLFLRSRGSRVRLNALVQLYIIGYFFNNFGPGTLGGDVARGYALGRCIGSQSDSMGTVFLERFTGMIALMALAILAAAANPSLVANPHILLFVALAGILLIGMVLFLVSPALQALMRSLLDLTHSERWKRVGDRFFNVVFCFQKLPAVLWAGMGLSVLFHLLTVVNVAAACWALGLPFRMLDLAVAVPLILLVGSIPVSLNALGIMEGAFVYFLALSGMAATDALSVGLVFRAKNILLALAGALLWMIRSFSQEA